MKKKEEKPAEPPNLDYLDEQTLLEEEMDNNGKESESDNEQFSLEDTAKHAREFLEEDLSAKFIKVNIVNIIVFLSLLFLFFVTVYPGVSACQHVTKSILYIHAIIQQSFKILTKGKYPI